MRPGGLFRFTAAFLHGALWLALATPASAQVSVPITVTGDVARGTIALPGGVGAELTITFEDVVGLHPGALEVTATLVDPNDPALLARLPSPLPGLPWLPVPRPVTIPAQFPVLLRISPPATGALSFAGIYSISLYTHDLQLEPGRPLALFKASDGGLFRDIMVSEGMGSYRAGGSGGDFSEFLVVVDRRPIDTVILEKFVALDLLLVEHVLSIPPAVLTELLEGVLRARNLFGIGSTLAALLEIEAFSNLVAAHSGEEIPDVWRAQCGDVNVAGLLRSAANTLKFSLDRKAN